MQNRYLSIRDACQYTGLSERYLFEKRMDKAIRYLKIGKKVLFDIKDLDVFMQRNAVDSTDWDEKVKELR